MKASTRPIIIAATPRSGSSLTAGLLAQHGVWTGHCRPPDKRNPKGYFENIRLKLLDNYREETVLGVLEDEGWAGERWLVKQHVSRWRHWLPFNPRFVLCRRATSALIKSWKKHDQTKPYRILKRRVHRDNKAMGFVRDNHGGIDFSPGSIVESWDEFYRLCEKLEIQPDIEKCEAFFEPSLWSGG